MNAIIVVLVVVLLASPALGDVYMQMLRGSNNRLDEANRERNNANRLFDSQNNNRGGYNVGSSYYSVGEIVRLEWTNQHSCNSGNAFCELILQYMCDDWLRDGTTTDRIPNTPEADGNPEWGRHESYQYYKACTTRQRNRGLFTASQNLDGDTAQFTRQNPNGNRHGFECPEERDYYPYWHPTPWKDIAVFTDNMERCRTVYQRESQNVRNKGACFNATAPFNEIYMLNNAAACTALRHEWKQLGAWRIDPPQCVPAPWTRDNHLGNTFGGNTPAWNWTVPDDVHERCVLRLRYNISTNDYPYDTNATFNDADGLRLNLAKRFRSQTPYPFTNNPEVDIGNGLELELAINTAQIGRTFQDRSHRFRILPPIDPMELPHPDAKVHNLNVMGKRGNIVQTFPAQEYFFVPEVTNAKTGDLIHIQWSGSNTNPANNDGQGQAQSDRHNMMEINENDLGRVLPENITEATLFNITVPYRKVHNLFKQSADGHYLALTNPAQHGGEMSELDDAGTYFDGGLFVLTKTGTKHYMNSRNNNFSNRQQKATIVVEQGPTTHDIGFIVGMTALSVFAVILLAVGGYSLYQHANKPAATPAPV